MTSGTVHREERSAFIREPTGRARAKRPAKLIVGLVKCGVRKTRQAKAHFDHDKSCDNPEKAQEAGHNNVLNGT